MITQYRVDGIWHDPKHRDTELLDNLEQMLRTQNVAIGVHHETFCAVIQPTIGSMQVVRAGCLRELIAMARAIVP